MSALWLTYALVAAITACRISTLAAWDILARQKEDRYSIHASDTRPGFDAWFGGVLAGLATGAVWPVTIVAYLARGFLFAPPAEIREQRKQDRIRELEETNARLERELEVENQRFDKLLGIGKV